MRDVDGVVGVDEKGHHIIGLRFVCAEEFFKRFHFGNVARFESYFFSVFYAVFENHFKGTAHIEERRVVPAVGFARFLRFDATDDVIVSRVF